MNFEEKKTTYKEVTENSDALSKNLKLESKNKLQCRWNVTKSQSEWKKFDAIDIRLYLAGQLFHSGRRQTYNVRKILSPS